MRHVPMAEYLLVLRQLGAANERVDALVAEVARLSALVAAGNDRLGELASAMLRGPGRTAPTPKAPPPPASLAPEARDAYESRPQAEPPPAKEKPPKKPRRPTGRKPLPDHLPVDRHVVEPTACKECGGTELELVDEVFETKLHVVEQNQRKREVVRKT